MGKERKYFVVPGKSKRNKHKKPILPSFPFQFYIDFSKVSKVMNELLYETKVSFKIVKVKTIFILVVQQIT